MRKEADDVGPKAELDHWKKRMAKFNSLLDQIKGTECKAVVGVLHAAKSKLLKVCYLKCLRAAPVFSPSQSVILTLREFKADAAQVSLVDAPKVRHTIFRLRYTFCFLFGRHGETLTAE